jgi:hypothetical protein
MYLSTLKLSAYKNTICTLKIIRLLIYQVCTIECKKISQWGNERDKYFVDEVETQLREKLLRGSQTQGIHYSEDKAYT